MFRLRITGDIGVEVWQDIEGFNGKYQVSNYGRFKTKDWGGKGIEEILKLSPRKAVKPQYSIVTLNRKAYNAHRIVINTFKPNPENKPCIDHIDTNPQNNRIENLRYVTHKENNENPLTMKHLKKGNFEKRSHHILQYEKGTKNIIAWYPSLREAFRQTGYTAQYLKRYCEGTQKCRKYDWELTDKTYTCKWGKWWETGDWEQEEN